MCTPQIFRKSFAKLVWDARSLRIILGPPVVVAQIMLLRFDSWLMFSAKLLLIALGVSCVPRKGFISVAKRRIHGYAMKALAAVILYDLLSNY